MEVWKLVTMMGECRHVLNTYGSVFTHRYAWACNNQPQLNILQSVRPPDGSSLTQVHPDKQDPGLRVLQ